MGPWVRIQAADSNVSVIFFVQTFSHFFLLKNTKGVSLNYVDAFKTTPPPFLDLCPHAWNKLAYSAIELHGLEQWA